jgi:diguanylate cyclase (GGDEF)-like protein/PAS domain S-box-containing protein
VSLITKTVSLSLFLLWLSPANALADRATIKSASELDYPPFSVTQSDGSAGGFSVELMRAALHEVGREVNFEVRPWYQISSDLAEGKLDALPLVGKSPEREQLFDFSTPYLTLYGAVFVQEDNTNIQKFKDLEGLRVGVMQGDTAQEFMLNSSINTQLITFTNYSDALSQLSEERLDAVVMQRLAGLELIKKLQIDNLKAAINPLKEFRQQFCFAVTKGNHVLLNLLDEGLSVTIADGSYDRLREKWMSVLDRENLQAQLFFRMTIFALVVIVIFVIVYILYREKKLSRATLKTLAAQNAILSAIPDLLFEVDHEGRYLNVWALDEKDLALQKSQLLGRTVSEVLPEPAAKTAMMAIQEASEKGISRGQQILIETQNGESWFELTVAMQNTGDIKQRHFIVLSRNISERKLNENQLKISANVFKYAREGIIITDANGNILDTNDAFTAVTGYTRGEALGKNPRILASGYQTPGFYAAMWKELKEKGHWYGEVTNKRKNNEIYIEFLSITTSYDEKGDIKNYVGIFSDITQQKENQKKLEHIAHYDALTQLPNRVLLGDRLNQLMMQTGRRNQYLAVVFLDLDGFKEVNDKFGHQAGDLLLSSMANRLKNALRDGDTIARIGGDEFVAVLSDLNQIDDSLPYLSRLLQAASTPTSIQEDEVELSASLGVTFYSSDKTIDADLLIRQADQAMYQAKLAGKNQYYIFDSDKDQIIREKYEDLESISNAIKEKQFVLYYQPKVNMKSGELMGVEALIRWQHPDKGLKLPGEFLSTIEGNPMSIELGEWVIENALLQIEQWRQAGFEIPVSINISACHLQQLDFTRNLFAMVSAQPTINPELLEIEILETNALEDINHVSSVIKGCKDIGIKFSLDDFGTGYSSLNYLKRLPVSTLKIDRNFVKDILVDSDDLSILEGIISMAAAFRLNVIAEGVESIEQGRLLLQLGCEHAQGFCIAKPMPAEKIPHWKDNWIPDNKWQQQQPVKRDDIPLLVAGIEHNAWIKRVMDYLDDRVSKPAEMNLHECRFGQWLDGEGKERYHTSIHFEPVVNLHKKIHKLAQELITEKFRDKNTAFETRQLSHHKNELIEKLNLMLSINN